MKYTYKQIDLTKQIEVDRQIANRSTYSSCGCGFGHVDGCKTRVTERILIASTIAVGSVLCWWYFIA